MKAKETESVKVDSKLKRKVKKHIKNTRQTIGGFYDLAVHEKIQRELHLELSPYDKLRQSAMQNPTQ